MEDDQEDAEEIIPAIGLDFGFNDAARSAEDKDEWRNIIRAANPPTGGLHYTVSWKKVPLYFLP